MEDKKKPLAEPDSVELHNREVNDMMGDAPAWVVKTGSYAVYSVIILLFIGTAFFSYPDTVTGTVIVNDLENVEWVVANTSGPIDQLFVMDKSEVKRNDTIGVIKNAAVLQDVIAFCDVLSRVERYYRTEDVNLLRNYPFYLILGDMKESYKRFTLAVRNILDYEELNGYEGRKQFYEKELAVLERDPVANELNIIRIQKQLFDLKTEHRLNREHNKKQLELAYEDAVNSLIDWESKYLLKSNSTGIIVMGAAWAQKVNVNAGDTICSVISGEKGQSVGKMRLTQEKVAGLEPGNQVNIQLSEYPARTHGYLVGKLGAVSYVPASQNYAIEIELPDKLITTSGKEIDYDVSLTGQAEIIISSKSLLARIFGPIYSLIINN